MVLAQPYDGRGARAHLGVYGMDVTLRNSIRNGIVSTAAIYLIVTAGMAISRFFDTPPLPMLHKLPPCTNGPITEACCVQSYEKINGIISFDDCANLREVDPNSEEYRRVYELLHPSKRKTQ